MMLRLSVLLLCLCSVASSNAQLVPSSKAQAMIGELGLSVSNKKSNRHHRWRKPKRVLLVVPKVYTLVVPDMVARIKEVTDAEGVELSLYEANTSIQPDLANVEPIDVFMGWCYPGLEAAANGSLRWVQLYDSHAPSCLVGEGINTPVVSNMAGLDAPNRAEHAIAMMLMLNSRLLSYYNEQQKVHWNRALALSLRGNEIKGQTLLLLGYNQTTLEIARRAAALGMHVIASSDSVSEQPFYIDYLAKRHQLLDLASQADIVINVQNDATKEALLVDEKFLAKVRKGSLYLSVAPSRLTSEADLIKSLREGRLSGAALDSSGPKPLDENSALWRMPNVLITPNISATNSRQVVERKVEFLRENLRRYLAGETLLNIQHW